MAAAIQAWAGLPPVLRDILLQRSITPQRPDLWQYLWESEEDARTFLADVGQNSDDPALGAALRALRVASEGAHSKRGRATAIDRALPIALSERAERDARTSGSNLVGELELLKAREPKAKERRKWRRRLEKELTHADDNKTREKLEANEQDRWAGELARELDDLKLPRSVQASLTADPRRSMLRAIGATRCRTVRARLRKWQAFRRWLLATHGVSWPRHVGHLIDYLECLASEPCGRTIPRSVVLAVAFMEDKGEVDPVARISGLDILKNTLRSIEAELSRDAPEVKKAPSYLVIMLISLEGMVADKEVHPFFRVYAWTLLLRVWGGLKV
jgi:hypothetical protein